MPATRHQYAEQRDVRGGARQVAALAAALVSCNARGTFAPDERPSRDAGAEADQQRTEIEPGFAALVGR